MKHFILIVTTCVLCSLLAIPVFGQAKLDPARISFQVVDLKSGKVLKNVNQNMCCTPASITKLITTATALELLGPDFRFETTIQYSGTITNGVLKGDLIVKGGGDPTLGSYYLGNPNIITTWAHELQKRGIKRIEGNLIADATCFDREPIPVHWSWEDMGNYYAAGIYGLSIYDNTMRYYFRTDAPGTRAQLNSVSPSIPELKIDNQLMALSIAADSGYIYGMPYDNRRFVRGGIPAHRANYMIRGDIPNPPMLVVQRLDSTLKTNGIIVTGRCKEAQSKIKDCKTLFVHQSLPLKDIIKLTNFKSNNLYAEHIFKRLALEKYHVATDAKAAQVVKDYWSSKHIDVNGLFMYDGSGLSADNAFSANTLNQILRYMYNTSKYKTDFISSLPRAGKEGTVAGFLINTPMAGHIWMKSGSINRVQCYSGYYIENNKAYAFTVMVNHWVGSRKEIRAEIKKWLLELSNL